MKTIALAFFLCGFSTLGFSQNNLDSLNICDSTYIFDYRMLYNDYTSNLTDLLETKLDERYNVFVFYWGTNDASPENMLISITFAGYTEYETFMPVCKAEELFQKGQLINYLKNKFDAY
jgi:hypothetical protein